MSKQIQYKQIMQKCSKVQWNPAISVELEGETKNRSCRKSREFGRADSEMTEGQIQGNVLSSK